MSLSPPRWKRQRSVSLASCLADPPTSHYTAVVQIEQDQSIPEVAALLSSLAEALPSETRSQFEDDIAQIVGLIVPSSQFSVDHFVANEVRRALRD